MWWFGTDENYQLNNNLKMEKNMSNKLKDVLWIVKYVPHTFKGTVLTPNTKDFKYIVDCGVWEYDTYYIKFKAKNILNAFNNLNHFKGRLCLYEDSIKSIEIHE